ncbi:MAG: alpha-N-arabinofuranosidase [Kiritimatiellae bacterium]|nr:alpha-N-arabinofuranosidase [Kiritimatiellia bacterium]
MDASLTLLPDLAVGPVADELFGSFVEHLGRAVYGGIYEPGHPAADASGFRRDVIDLVRELRVPVVRYPGGNFLSGYDWRDGVGPRERRPVRLDRAWHSVETNRIGIDEFCDWAREAGAEVMAGVNMGTGTPQDAADLVEYCNHPGGTAWSDLRARNGHRDPHAIRWWCVGNEMDGDWQIGHLDALSYGRKAREAMKLMRWTDERVKLVVCGSAGPGMATWPEWDRIVLEQTYDLADCLSIHRYYENAGNDDDFLSVFRDTDRFIETSAATCDYVKAKTRSKKTMGISFDEWNIWYQSREEPHPWQEAPRILEDRYTLLDALAFSGMALSLLNHADRVRVACLAQLVNVIAPIVAEPGGPAWRQATFYPFRDVSLFGRGVALRPVAKAPVRETVWGDAPSVAFAATRDEAAGTLTVFALNADRARPMRTRIDLSAFGPVEMSARTELCGPDLRAANSAARPDAVRPAAVRAARGDGGRFAVSLKPASWNVLRFRVAGSRR